MTKEEIEALTAGPELDSLIATRFMGWEQGKYPCDVLYYLPGTKDIARFANTWEPSKPGGCWEEVLAKLQEKDPRGKIWWAPSNDGKLAYGISVDHPWKVLIVVPAPTFPLAVCRLALMTTVES